MMTNTRSHRNQRFQKKIIRNIFFLIIIIILTGTLGLKFLINFSIFVADFTKTGTREQSKSTDEETSVIILAPKIYNIPLATNSADIDINGSTTKGKTTKIVVNNDEYRRFISDSDEFSTNITLQSGKNDIYVEVTDTKTSVIKKSPIYTVEYIMNKPSLEISSPEDQSVVNKPEATIIGQTDKGVLIRINSLPVVADSEGSFSHTIRLKEGDNEIRIIAEDIAGNTEEKMITVKYDEDE